MKTLKKILKQFDDLSKPVATYMDKNGAYFPAHVMQDKIHDFLIQSIKDALEACRVEKLEGGGKQVVGSLGEPFWECVIHGQGKEECSCDGFNANTTQYDENVKKFIGEK